MAGQAERLRAGRFGHGQMQRLPGSGVHALAVIRHGVVHVAAHALRLQMGAQSVALRA